MTDPAYTPKSCWERYTAKADLARIHTLARRYIDFLSRCKTERETVDYAADILRAQGFGEGVRQQSCLKVFRGKALFAARRGALPMEAGLRLISAHVDTPRLDFKQRPFIEQPGVAQAKTHYYGGIRKYQWLARPLALHGVVARADGSLVRVIIGEEPDEPVFTIADLLPHLAQKHNTQTVADAFEAEKLNIILGHSPQQGSSADKKSGKAPADPIKRTVLAFLQKKYGLSEEDFISAEMQAVPAGPARFVGVDSALVGGYGHDDRICVYTALEAMMAAKNPQYTTVLILWDKEEIGSDGATGASSRFLEYCIDACRANWQPKARLADVMLNTRALSADVQAALDPDWQDVHEKHNAAQLGYGPCFSKFTGSRGKYGASEADAEFVGWMRGVLNNANIPWQMAECGRVDLGGGGRRTLAGVTLKTVAPGALALCPLMQAGGSSVRGRSLFIRSRALGRLCVSGQSTCGAFLDRFGVKVVTLRLR